MPTTPRLPFDDGPDAGRRPGPPAPGARRRLPDARDRADAVDPRLNVVLEASAGTGKTRVLVDRYVNLVRAGVEPRHILAITFTRKAAAEMRERILATLRRAAEEGGIDPRRWQRCASTCPMSPSARSTRSACRCCASSPSRPGSIRASGWPTRPRRFDSPTRRSIARCAICRAWRARTRPSRWCSPSWATAAAGGPGRAAGSAPGRRPDSRSRRAARRRAS